MLKIEDSGTSFKAYEPFFAVNSSSTIVFLLQQHTQGALIFQCALTVEPGEVFLEELYFPRGKLVFPQEKNFGFFFFLLKKK